MALIIQNVDTVNVNINDLGIFLAPGDTHDMIQEQGHTVAQSTDLPAAISAGSIEVLDPLDDVTPLSTSDALAAVAAMNDTHWRIKGGYIDQLGDVDTSGKTGNEILYYNSSSGDFEPLTISDGTGITTNIAGGVLTITNSAPHSDPNLFLNLTDGVNTATASVATDTFTFVAGAGITATVSAISKNLTITNTAPNVDQNLWETIGSDSGTAVADSTSDTLTIVGGSGISTAIVGDTLTITNTQPGSSQNVFDKMTDGTNTAQADTTTDTFTFTAGTGITLLINEVLDSLTITNANPNVDQNIWETITADSGSTTANTTTDTFNIVGGTNITTSIVGDTITIDASGGSTDELVKVSANDTTAGYLNGKLIAGTGITLTENADGGNETLSVINSAPNVDQNIWLTVAGDTGSTNANTTTDTLTISGGTGISTSVSGDTLTVTNDAPNVDQNLWETVTADSGSTTANTTTDTLNVVGGSGITTSISGDTLTISAGAGANAFGVVVGDTGTANADTTNDTISIVGGNKITTTAGDTPDTLTIDWGSLAINELTDVTTGSPAVISNNATLKYNSTTGQWEPQPAQPTPPPGSEASVQLKWGPIASASGTTSIPKDSTTPLITEGFEIWNETMTLQEPLSNVRVATNVTFSSSNSSLELVFAVFRDSTCIGTVVNSTSNKSSGFAISFELYDTPNPDPGGSPMYTYTYSCRVGRTGSGTWYINSIHNNTPITYFGGTLAQNSYSIEEMGIIS